MQPQIGVGGIRRRSLEIDVNQNNLRADFPSLVVDDCGDKCGRGGAVVSRT
jgi:hypothetical protein